MHVSRIVRTLVLGVALASTAPAPAQAEEWGFHLDFSGALVGAGSAHAVFSMPFTMLAIGGLNKSVNHPGWQAFGASAAVFHGIVGGMWLSVAIEGGADEYGVGYWLLSATHFGLMTASIVATAVNAGKSKRPAVSVAPTLGPGFAGLQLVGAF